MVVALDNFKELYDFNKSQAMVLEKLDRCKTEKEFVQLLAHYASWNGVFGSAVASLSGKIGTAHGIFKDPKDIFGGIAIPTLSDRSVRVASFIFEAARDEFDDRDFPHCRATHRCLAQATVIGGLGFLRRWGELRSEDIPSYLDRPAWLDYVERGVLCGYGHSTPDTIDFIYHAMGFHLGSEILADQEFSMLDKFIQQKFPRLHEWLTSKTINVDGIEFPAYSWISIHSGHGKHVEADHFEAALEGVNLSFQYINPTLHSRMLSRINDGFLAFAKNREDFFSQV